MQDRRKRSNKERSESTRASLIDAARRIFVERSYADTGTPELVAAAKVTRGALYHHFADKRALFEAVVEAECATVARKIENATSKRLTPKEALIAGGEAFLAAMREPGRTRLLLIDAPAALGRAALDAIDARHGARTLSEGLAAAMAEGAIATLPLDATTMLLAAAYDRAALAIDGGARIDEWRVVLEALIEGLAGSSEA